MDRSVLEELFEMLAQRFSSEEEDEVKVISLKLVQKRFFSANENIGMAKHIHTLSKIRALLLEKGLKADYPFREQKQANSSAINGSSKLMPVAAATTNASQTAMMRVGLQAFVDRILDLKPRNLSEKALVQLAQFLSVCSDRSQDSAQSFISLQTFQHYLRKLQTKDKYLLLQEYRLVHNEVRTVLDQEDQFLAACKKFHKSQLTLAEFRSVLNGLHVSHDLVDELIIRFVQDEQTLTPDAFLQRLREFIQQFEGLSLQKSMLASALQEPEPEAKVSVVVAWE